MENTETIKSFYKKNLKRIYKSSDTSHIEMIGYELEKVGFNKKQILLLKEFVGIRIKRDTNYFTLLTWAMGLFVGAFVAFVVLDSESIGIDINLGLGLSSGLIVSYALLGLYNSAKINYLHIFESGIRVYEELNNDLNEGKTIEDPLEDGCQYRTALESLMSLINRSENKWSKSIRNSHVFLDAEEILKNDGLAPIYKSLKKRNAVQKDSKDRR